MNGQLNLWIAQDGDFVTASVPGGSTPPKIGEVLEVRINGFTRTVRIRDQFGATTFENDRLQFRFHCDFVETQYI